MSNLPEQQTIVQYITNVSQFIYTFAFYAPLPTDIQVFYQAPNVAPIPESQILVFNVDYTVTYNADPITGGFITLLFTPITGYYLTINRNVMASLDTNFSNAQNFNGANLDAALDRLLLLCQQNQNYALERNLSYIINTYLPNAVPYTQLPPLPQNYFWVGSGAGIVAAQIATIPSASVLQSMLANASPGTDGALLVGFYDYGNNNSTTVDGAFNYRAQGATDSGSTNSLIISISPNYSLIVNSFFLVIAAHTNTGASTLQVNSITPVAIIKQVANGMSALKGGEILAGNAYLLFYDGTQFQLINPSFPAAYCTGVNNAATPQSIASSVATVLVWDTVVFLDSYGVIVWSGPFSYYLGTLVSGLHEIQVLVDLVATGTVQTLVFLDIYKNGILFFRIFAGNTSGGADNVLSAGGNLRLKLNAGDIIQTYISFIGNTGTVHAAPQLNSFQLTYLGN